MIGERPEARQVKQRHFRCLLFVRGLDGRANLGSERILF
jgi:hypothetical protein